MKIKTKDIFIGICVIIIFLLLRPCKKDVHVPRAESFIVEHWDTAFFERIDTVFIPKIKTVHVFEEEDLPLPEITDSFTVYDIPMSDSFLDITFKIRTEGKLKDFSFDYTPKFPKYIIKHDSIVITNTKEIYKHANEVYIGAEAVYQPDGTVAPFASISLKTKKNRVITYGYDPFHKAHKIGLQIKIGRK